MNTIKELAKKLLPPGAKLLYLVRAGSKAYGLDTPQSDDDYRGVFLPGPRGMLGYDMKDCVEVKSPDMGLMSLKKFVHLALAGNPNVTEQLFVEPKDRLYISPKFMPIMRRKRLLLAKSVYAPYAGYAKSQMLRAEKDRLDAKAMMHCLRLLWQATQILRSKELPVKVYGPIRDVLMAVRKGEVSHEVAMVRFKNLMEDLDSALFTSALKAEPPRKEFEYVVMAIQAKELKHCKLNEDRAYWLALGHRSGETCNKLAKRYSMNPGEVREMLSELGINTHRWGNPFERRTRVTRIARQLREGKTLEEVGKPMGLCKERVRQLAQQGGLQSLRRERKMAKAGL